MHDKRLRHPSTLGLMAGTLLVGFGGWIDFLAILTLAAYRYDASPLLMALISAAFLVPGIVLAPRVGRWLDRGRAERILPAALLLRCLATGALLVVPPVALFCVAVACRSAFNIPTDPAGNVLVARVVQPAAVPRYFGLLGLFRNLSKISAPTLGTAIASRFGEQSCFLLSIALTLAGMLCLLVGLRGLAPAGESAKTAIEPGPVAPGSALMTQLIWTVTIFAFMVFVINNQLPVLLRDAGFDKALLGLLVSCSGAGGILAATYMTRRNGTMGAAAPMRATIVAVLATAACFGALGLAFSLPRDIARIAACALFFGTGLFGAVEAIRSSTVVVQHFPTRVGAVSATVQAYQSAAILAAPWLAALVIPYVSMPALFAGDGLLGLIGVTLVSLRFRRAAARWAVAT